MATVHKAKSPEVPTRTSTAEHIAVEASKLARIAKSNEFPLLAYLIDMAVLEAWREAGEATGDSAAEGAEHRN